MLSRAIYQFKQTEELEGNVIYDRGVTRYDSLFPII